MSNHFIEVYKDLISSFSGIQLTEKQTDSVKTQLVCGGKYRFRYQRRCTV